MTTLAPAPLSESPVRAKAQCDVPRPGVLLTMADYLGTLAAVRAYGRAGTPVTVADGRTLTPARWSRHATQALSCPDVGAEPERLLEWLLALGAREPGQVLPATSDDTAWLFARYQGELSRFYRLYVPPFEAVYTLLNKWRLHRACLDLGIDTPETVLPESEADLPRLARAARFPLVIKPQTQAFLAPHQKGRVANGPETLAPLYLEFRGAARLAPLVLREDPGADRPIVQAFTEGAAEGIYNLSGFIDMTGALFVVEASRKLLQTPRRLGVGLCFEEADVRPELANHVARLCRHVGYHGPFEVEFLEADGRYLLIDFNPRFYGQMGFDIARGLDLPRLVYLAATGDGDGLYQAVSTARAATLAREGHAYCHRMDLEIVLRLRRLAGRLDPADEERWRRWLRANGPRLIDAVIDRDDEMPGVVAAAAAVFTRACHPRSTWRSARDG